MHARTQTHSCATTLYILLEALKSLYRHLLIGISLQDIGPLWKLACLWSMGVDVPQCAVIATYHEGAQTLEEAAGEKTYRDLS